MGLEEIIPAIFLIAVLVLVLPEFLRTNLKSKRFIKNLFIFIKIFILFLHILNSQATIRYSSQRHPFHMVNPSP